MSDCVDTIATEHMDYCPDQENAAGTSPTEIYGARVSDFLDIIAPPKLSAATTLAEAATIVGPHTFTPPKGFFKMSVLPETGVVETTNEGEKGSRSNRNSFGATLPGVTARNKGWIRKHQNVGMIFLVPDLNGIIHQIGSKISPAYLNEATPTTGVKGGDVNGIPFKIEDVQAYPAPVYTGAITEFTTA